MGPIIYKPQYIIPVLLQVLDLMAYFYSGIAFKFAVKSHYQELKGRISTDELSESGVELLTVLDDELIQRIGAVVIHITTIMNSISSIYKVDFEDIWADENVLLLAEDFYWAFMEDDFPEEEEEDEFDHQAYAHFLDVYVISLIRIVNRLVNLVINGEVDLTREYDTAEYCNSFQPKRVRLHSHTCAINLLCDLGKIINTHQKYVVEGCFNPNVSPKVYPNGHNKI